MKIGCLIILLFFGYLFVAYFPGYLAYKDQQKRRLALPYVETIHTSLKTYSDKQTNNLFPEKIDGYEALRLIVKYEGKSIPENQNETKIDHIKYETSDRKTYILRLKIKDNNQHFYILFPGGIIETYKNDEIDDNHMMALIRTLLNMDRALFLKDISEYVSLYSLDANISIKNTFYNGLSTEKNRRKIRSENYEDFSSYANSLEKFYNTALPKLRKRNEIRIYRNDTGWEVHSDYIEEGKLGGEKYIKDGLTLYTISLNKKPISIIGDKSFASIYFH